MSDLSSSALIYPTCHSFFASKDCTYTDAAGRPVPATRSFKPDASVQQQGSSSSNPRNFTQSSFPSSSASNQFRVYPKPPPSHHQNNLTDDEHKHARKRFRNERGNPMSVDDLVKDGPISTAAMDRAKPIDLDPALTRELTNCTPDSLVLYHSIQSSYSSILYPLSPRKNRCPQTYFLYGSQPQPCPNSPPAGNLCRGSAFIKTTSNTHNPCSICRTAICSRSPHTNV